MDNDLTTFVLFSGLKQRLDKLEAIKHEVPVVQDGQDGKDGVGIKKLLRTPEHRLLVINTDGEEFDLGSLKGEDGVGVKRIKWNKDKELIIETDKEEINLGCINGKDGDEVIKAEINRHDELVLYTAEQKTLVAGNVRGRQGERGIGIKSISLDDYNLTINTTDDEQYQLGNIRGDKGEKGDKGEEGNGITDIYIDEQGYLVIKTQQKTFKLRLPARKSFGTSRGIYQEFRYTNTLPMPNKVGGICKGTTFDDVPLNVLMTKLLYSYDLPIFTEFNIVGLELPLEVGAEVTGMHQVIWNIKNLELLAENSISIKYMNDYLARNVANEHQLSIVLPLITDATTLKIEAKTTCNELVEKELKLEFLHRFYFGESDSTVLSVDDIKALRNQLGKPDSYKFNAGGYKYIVCPALLGPVSRFYNIADKDDVPFTDPTIVTITNQHGLNIEYLVYRSINKLGRKLNIGTE